MPRKPWEITFVAEPAEVAALRRIMRLHLGIWGLQDVSDEAELCVSELASNVITHVGAGTPATLAVAMQGTHLRIEMHDPDTRALPILQDAGADSEGGRGMALIDAVADRWGVQIDAGRKVAWCELVAELASPAGQVSGGGAMRAEVLLGLYTGMQLPRDLSRSRLSMTIAEEAVIDIVTDLLHWLRVQGFDPDEAIDRAQRHFDAQVDGAA
ncbi:ATP-binding protein [Streptomyces sp. NPDC006132]|uniref:ATP-binding protein n=1 Tax=Streptomyces sp. NPDC006132 TaxID=3156732 RepID=UPI0033D42A73